MTRDNSRYPRKKTGPGEKPQDPHDSGQQQISKKSFGEDPVMMVCQRPLTKTNTHGKEHFVAALTRIIEPC
ncbi:hypothetical protein STEG23_036423 [Scotinomys teguina]